MNVGFAHEPQTEGLSRAEILHRTKKSQALHSTQWATNTAFIQQIRVEQTTHAEYLLERYHYSLDEGH